MWHIGRVAGNTALPSREGGVTTERSEGPTREGADEIGLEVRASPTERVIDLNARIARSPPSIACGHRCPLQGGIVYVYS